MGYFDSIIYGFSIVFQPVNFLSCFWGVLIGNLIGVLPGLGPAGTIALLLPFTIGASPVTGIIMLSGIYYGAMYGGSITSILVNIPGEAASVVTCLDGYQMARQGRAGPALGIAAFGSFIAGTIGVLGLMFLANPLASLALRFGPPEYFTLMCLGLTMVVYLTQGSIIKGLITAVAGFIVSQIGRDIINATPRFTFGLENLDDGVGIIPAVMGLLGVAEVLLNIEKSSEVSVFKTKIKGLLPNFQDWAVSIWAIIRGTVIGFFLGILPGGGSIVASFVSYAVEKRVSKHPEKFGKGAIEGVAGPESANNSATAGAFIPLFSLGIPANVVMALLLGALMIHGVQPGPLMLVAHPEVFWGAIASMYLGNIMLLVLNIPMIGLWVKLLKIPYRILFPLILVFMLIGGYSANSSTFDVVIMLIFGVIGYLFKKFEYEPAPLVLAFILGPIMENAFRQSLLLSAGSLLIFLTRPISVAAFVIMIMLLASGLMPFARKFKHRIDSEQS
jgi:putative tricarboxylic transport membrane protein